MEYISKKVAAYGQFVLVFKRPMSLSPPLFPLSLFHCTTSFFPLSIYEGMLPKSIRSLSINNCTTHPLTRCKKI